MIEAVSRTYAHQGYLGVPQGERLGRQTVHAAVVRNLQHLDGRDRSIRDHAALGLGLSVSGEYRVDLAGGQLEYDTRVIGVELMFRLCRRPQHAHVRRTNTPAIASTQRPDRRLRTDPRRVVLNTRRTDGRHPHPPDAGHAREARGAPSVVGVGVREHHDVEAPDTGAREGSSHRGRIGANVHQHRAPAVLQQDRVCLPHVQDHHRGRTRRHGAQRECDTQPHDRQRERPRLHRATRDRPANPDHGCEHRRYDHEKHPGPDRDSRAGSSGQVARQPRGDLEYHSRQAHDGIAQGWCRRSDHRARKPQAQTERYQRRGIRVGKRGDDRQHAEGRRNDRRGEHLGDTREREGSRDRSQRPGHPVCRPDRCQGAEEQEPADGEHRELKAEIENRPGLDRQDRDDRHGE